MRLVSFLAIGVPGLCFLVVGTLNREYPTAILGGVLIMIAAYRMGIKQMPRTPPDDYKRQRLSFGLGGIIGASLAINGFVSDGNWVGVAGVVILIGSLLQLYRTRLSNRP
jgi:hypothetical protein